MFNKHDISRDACQLYGGQARKGYDWWWHSFTAHDAETGASKPFFIEFFTCNPDLARPSRSSASFPASTGSRPT